MVAQRTKNYSALTINISVLSLVFASYFAQSAEQFSFSYTFDASARGTPGEILSGVLEVTAAHMYMLARQMLVLRSS